MKNATKFGKEDKFDQNVVDVRDNEDSSRYYGGFIFVPSISDYFNDSSLLMSAVDSVNFESFRPQNM